VAFDARGAVAKERVWALVADPSGGLWIGSDRRLAFLRAGEVRSYSTENGLPKGAVRSLCRDRDGDVWVGMSDALARWHDGRISVEGAREGLSGTTVHDLFEDREGSLWISTLGKGLFLRSGGRLTRHTTE